MASKDQAPDPPVNDEAIWQALSSDPTVGVSVVTIDGTIVYVNERASRLFVGMEPARAIGHKLDELFPEEWSHERVELIRNLCQTCKPVGLRSIWKGRQMYSFLYPVVVDSGVCDRALVVTHGGEIGDMKTPWGEPFVESEFVELGPLDTLSPRELEVLALVGQGMRIRDVAQALYRSEKTIDKHRTAIGRKLNASDRVQLARIARTAGLRLSDAHLKRIRSKDGPGPKPQHTGR